MRYYTVQNNSILTADNSHALERFYNNVLELPLDYEAGKYIVVDGGLVLNPDWEEEQKQKERERIAKLSLTKREVFLALYRAKGITPEMVRVSIQDEEALIEFDYATEYYRFNPLIDAIGEQLGYTPEDLDYLFINKELPEKVISEVENEDTTDTIE